MAILDISQLQEAAGPSVDRGWSLSRRGEGGAGGQTKRARAPFLSTEKGRNVSVSTVTRTARGRSGVETRKVATPGGVPGRSLGGLAMFLTVLVVDAVLGFSARINLNPVPDESRVYAVLKESVTEPGRYVANPALTDKHTFPEGEPVFSILYGGVGHEAAGRETLLKLPLFFLLPVLAAGMLSLAGGAGLPSYGRKVLFFVGVGVLVGASSHLSRFGIGSYPLENALALALHDVGLWTIAGLVMAWRIRPAEA